MLSPLSQLLRSYVLESIPLVNRSYVLYFYFRILLISIILRFIFFFNDPAPTEISPLPLHAALPISRRPGAGGVPHPPGGRDRRAPDPLGEAATGELPARGRSGAGVRAVREDRAPGDQEPRPHPDRKSTRLNSSHGYISYAVFCLKKK